MDISIIKIAGTFNRLKNSFKTSKMYFEGFIEYRSDDITKTFFFFFFFCISAFSIPCIGGAWWKTSTAQIWWESVHGGPEIWPHEYLISHTEISVNWPGSKQLWTMPIYTYFKVIYEPIHVKFGVWGFSSCSTEIWSWKCWNAKKENLMTSHFSTLYAT